MGDHLQAQRQKWMPTTAPKRKIGRASVADFPVQMTLASKLDAFGAALKALREQHVDDLTAKGWENLNRAEELIRDTMLLPKPARPVALADSPAVKKLEGGR